MCLLKEKEAQAGEEPPAQEPRSPGGGRPRALAAAAWREVADPSSLPEPGTGTGRDFRSFQAQMMQKGMIIKIPSTSKRTKRFL